MTDDIPGSDLGRVQDLLEGLLHRLRGHDGQGHGGFVRLLVVSFSVCIFNKVRLGDRESRSLHSHSPGRRRVNVAVIDDGGSDG